MSNKECTEAKLNDLNSSNICYSVTTSDLNSERKLIGTTGTSLLIATDGSQQDERSDTPETDAQSVLERSEHSSMQNDQNKEKESNEYDSNAAHPSLTEFFQNSRVDAFGFIQSLNNTNHEATVNLETLRKREKKWLHMLTNWSYFMDNKYEKVKERCRKGIPPSLRGRAWKHLCGAAFHMEFSVNKHVFEEVVNQPGDPRWVEDIKKDLNRQFPEHVMFSRAGPYGKGGKSDLFELLKAYTVLHPEEGYCQGQAPVAAVLLMHMPLRDAFYCFVQICHKYLPGYYSAGLEAIQIDGDILFQVLKDKSHFSYRHLKKHRVEPVLYMVEWFMCIFCRTLPWPTVLRVWDMFFCEGVKVLFKIAVVLFRYGLRTNDQLREFNDFHSIVTRLKNLPKTIMTEDFLIQKVIDLDLDDVELEKIHCRTLKTRQLRLN
ncbi:ankyrin repeat-containing protein [Loa loa]|uniref:Ankyrin repeat-containing protein n=1 Tax=Loa loa TaxID=7209 RepID=A0A1I7VED9_LOALO|nr:ankyrin repeat-containing protein [Loa loa]EJD74405.1 ankyrin repeat-containing protein [Loa loa]